MKVIKKIAAIMFALVMVISMGANVSVAHAEEGAQPGTKGTLTITNPIQGQEYAVYKIMELESFSGDNYSYKVANEWKEFFDSGEGKNYVTIDKNEYVHWNGDESKVAEFAKSALEYANNHKDKINPIKNGENGVTVVEGTNADSTKNITYNNLSLGYYLVGSSTGALCSLDTTKPSATIKEKNEKPTVVKKINNESGLVSKDSAFIGDQVVYEINITAGVGAKNYVLHDKMDAGLELVNGGIQIFDNKGSGHLTTSDYRIVTSGITDGCAFHIEFTEEYLEKLDNTCTITVQYVATVKNNAPINVPINNTAWLSYGDGKTTTNSITETYVCGITVNKYTTNGGKKGLKDAEFNLYKEDGTICKFEKKWK